MKNSSDTIGNRTRDLSACSTVPKPIAPLQFWYAQKFVSSPQMSVPAVGTTQPPVKWIPGFFLWHKAAGA